MKRSRIYPKKKQKTRANHIWQLSKQSSEFFPEIASPFDFIDCGSNVALTVWCPPAANQ